MSEGSAGVLGFLGRVEDYLATEPGNALVSGIRMVVTNSNT